MKNVNDVGWLTRDPVMRAITRREDFDWPAASESQMGRFETGTIADNKNLITPSNLNGKWVGLIQQLLKTRKSDPRYL